MLHTGRNLVTLSCAVMALTEIYLMNLVIWQRRFPGRILTVAPNNNCKIQADFRNIKM